MACISSSSLSVLWNGDKSQAFTPTRGVRQGDPLSPYIFVLCMERLSQLITRECEVKRWKPLRLRRTGPPLSHLFFTDDLILFFEANIEQMRDIKGIMSSFCRVSGHRINLSKSKMFCSKNVHHSRAMELSRELGVGLTGDLGKYLGVPILNSRQQKSTYFPIVQKVQKRLSLWKSKFPSIAGWSVLIKSVLAAMPSYQMQSTLLPSSTIHEIDKLSRKFLWSQDTDTSKMHLISWRQVIASKDRGGLGFKDLKKHNQAFIMKLRWGLTNNTSSLWVKRLRSKYNCGPSLIPQVNSKAQASATWRSITKVWEKFQRGIGFKVDNGWDISFWWDRWLPLRPCPILL